MDDFTSQFLHDHGLESYATTFREQRISQKSFKFIDESCAEKLIPPLGDRLIFLEALQALKSANSASDILDALYTGNQEQIEVILSQPSSSAIPIAPISPTKRVATEPVEQNTGPPQKKVRTTILNSSGEENEWCDIDKLTESEREELAKYLKGILEKSLDGLAVLSAYKHSGFDHTIRAMLSELLVAYEMNDAITKRINCLKFRKMALSIQSVFPAESPLIYYVPHVNLGKGKKINPKGKLYEKYTRKLRIYRDSGLLPQNQATPSIDSTDDPVNTGPTCDEELLTVLNWLRTALDPFDRIAASWLMTCAKRLFDYNEQALSISEYFKQYPALTCEFGLKLISTDFNHLYPDKSNALSDIWTTLLENILKIAKRRFVKEAAFRKLISNDVPNLMDIENLSQQEKNYYCFTILPYLLTPSNTRKVGNEPVKYTRKESKDSFLLHIPVGADLRPELKRRNEAHQLTGQEIQPQVIVTGTDTSNFTYYVEVNETLYVTESLLQAVDGCFQTFMVLNAKYPPAAEKIWLFVQRYIFKIKTQYDNVRYVLPQLEALAVDLGVTGQ